MNPSSARIVVVYLILSLAAGCCWSASIGRTPDRWARKALPRVTCSTRRIRAVFGPLVLSNLHVKDKSGARVPVPPAEDHCGVRKGRERNHGVSFISRYDSCYALIEGNTVVVPLVVQLAGNDRWFNVNISCSLVKRHGPQPNLSLVSFPEKCNTPSALRINCGPQSISAAACHKLGCCFDAHHSSCFHRLDACSLDGHFVFTVRAEDRDPPINPSSLIVKDQPHCTPVITTADIAVFKIGIKDCGAKMKIDSEVMSYVVEVEEGQNKTGLKRSPFSLQVHCDFVTSDIPTATNPPPVTVLGTVRVQMRIATDASFTSFFPEEQLPLTFPLRKPIYVEVSIAQPSLDLDLSLRVRDCFAYPASRHSVWTLLYDGCPNPLDNMRSSILVEHRGKSNSQTRRFDVKTFAFFDPHTGRPSVEEMYFYCWVEICTEDAECPQSCSFILHEGERQRREAGSKSSQVELVSLGPLLVGQNSTNLKENPCNKQNTAFQVTLCTLSAVGTTLLLILLLTVWASMRPRHPAAEQPSDRPTETEQTC